MGGLDWTAFDLAVERFDIEDPADLADRLVCIREHMKEINKDPTPGGH